MHVKVGVRCEGEGECWAARGGGFIRQVLLPDLQGEGSMAGGGEPGRVGEGGAWGIQVGGRRASDGAW